MKAVLENSRAARMADYRLVLGDEDGYCPPSENMDMIFTEADKLDNPIHAFDVCCYGQRVTIATTQEKIDNEFSGSDVNRAEWLEKIKAAEKEVWECAIGGAVYYMLVQKWDAAEREFKTIDGLYQLYGHKDIEANIDDMTDIDKCTVIVDASNEGRGGHFQFIDIKLPKEKEV